jgi:hypothetical protein
LQKFIKTFSKKSKKSESLDNLCIRQGIFPDGGTPPRRPEKNPDGQKRGDPPSFTPA